MPRIAASMMVVAAVVCSIGLNIQRYPVVWKMVAVPEQVTQPDESDSDAWADDTSDTYGYSQYESPVASINSGSGQGYSSDTYGNDSYGNDSYQNDSSDSSSYSYSNQDETDEYGGYSGQDNSDSYSGSSDSYSDSSENSYSHPDSYSDPYSGDSGGSSYSGDSSGSYDSESTYGQSGSEGSSEYGDYSYQNDSGAYQGESSSQSGGYAATEESNDSYDYQSPDYQSPDYQSQQSAYGSDDQDGFPDPPGLAEANSSSMSYGQESTQYGQESTGGYGSSSSSQYGRKWPAEAQSAEKYGSIVEETGSVNGYRPKRPLVPINRSDDYGRESEYAWNDNSSYNSPDAPSRPESTFDRPTATGIRRLPRVERQIPIPADAYANRLPESPIPVYPSTGY